MNKLRAIICHLLHRRWHRKHWAEFGWVDWRCERCGREFTTRGLQ